MLNIGDTVGYYEIEGVLGEGGMAVVYRARHRSLQSAHAIKVLHSHLLARLPDIKERFLNEGRVQAQYRHPNIMPVSDLIAEPGVAALVMPLLEGRSLESLLEQQRTVELQQALSWTQQILKALALVHAKGVVHRDLKPDNLFIEEVPDEPPKIRVMDFGIAKLADKSLTHTGVKMGTEGYMAPEQFRSASSVDGRTDLFAVGVILYKMLSGELPFPDIASTILGHLKPLDERCPQLPKELVALVHRSLSKDPAQRPESARSFQEALAPKQQTTLEPVTLDDSNLEERFERIASHASAHGLRLKRPTQLSERWLDYAEDRVEQKLAERHPQKQPLPSSGTPPTQSTESDIPPRQTSGRNKVIGIDLGTYKSVISIMEGGKPTIITNREGARATPSVVSFTKIGERLVGTVAKRQAITNPARTVSSIKRFMGRRYGESKSEIDRVPYEVTCGSDGLPRVKIDDNRFSPPEISAIVLQKLKREAERYLGTEVTEAVITVPAYFNDSQRQATKDAGKIAGLEVKRIINEPTATALAYGLERKDDQVIAVYDFGGGTFDISILEVGDSVVEVKSTNGDTHLGGDDVDQVLVDWMIKTFKADTGIDLGGDKMVLPRLKDAAEKAKIDLSTTQSTEVNVPFLTADATGSKHFQQRLSRARFEQMIEPVIERTLNSCKKALKDANLKVADINQIILVGGSTRIPLVQQKVKEFFNKEPNHSMNPDEVVAIGAAIRGGIFSGDITDILLLDVIPFSLGIETLGGVNEVLISRNTIIPAKKIKIFTTTSDNQSEVDISVFQGERPMAKDNRPLGAIRLSDIPTAPRGTPQIEIRFDVNADGILNVSAKDRATGNRQNATIISSFGLDRTEAERLFRDFNSISTEQSLSHPDLKPGLNKPLHQDPSIPPRKNRSPGSKTLYEPIQDSPPPLPRPKAPIPGAPPSPLPKPEGSLTQRGITLFDIDDYDEDAARILFTRPAETNQDE